MKKQHLLDEIERTAEQNGGVPLGRQRFLAETGIRESDWTGRYWTKWSDAVRDAGYVPNTRQRAFDEDYLLEKLASLVRELGYYPVVAELRMKRGSDPEFPSHNTFARFGRKAQVASALLSWCESSPGWDDVQAICAPLAVRAEADEVPVENETAPAVGYVYLLKSGKYYKIGRSNAPGRREYELSIQLPEPVVTVHTIKTDDSVGIEQYWHQRFEERRKNGEWFELRREDVSAFRRRKFM
ncbi:MAG: GIY-YIG nuclease family protein [Candidatus Marinimicrobia bacterium]|nr:GIY-YIG nuclease family protein [Candidatus Neomarinimicrobiota bacterium]